MLIQLNRNPLPDLAADALIVLGWEGGPPALGLACDAEVAELYSSGEFKGKALETALVRVPRGLAVRRLLVVGAGKEPDFTAADLRRAVGAGIRQIKGKGVRSVAFYLPANLAQPAHAAAAVEGALTGHWEPDRLKTDPEKAASVIDSFTVAAPDAGQALEQAVERGRILAESQNFTRDLVNEPANLLPPLELAARARALAAEVGLDCEVLDQDRMRQLGMGSLLGVAQGSLQPPVLIVLRYAPAPVPTGDHLALIGKGVTFDSGGISIKPADGMEKMKYDMAGAAAVLGAMRAIALLKPGIAVTGLIPAVENMVSGAAQRPGDIVTTLSGKTVEVLNTDAEGRLILNDTLTYAQRLGCTHLVDAATLTGAIVVALGHVHVGAFTNNQPLLDRVLAAARAQGEKMWPMPLDDDYKEQLKSSFADLANIGTRWGGAVTAAYFLKEFADPTPWVHLDIAGTAWQDEAKPFVAKGPTGVAVRTFAELALSWGG